MKFTLRGLRAQFGLTREQEARLLHVSPFTLYNAETGKHQLSFGSVAKIANLYNVNLSDITLKPKYRIPINDKDGQ